MARISKHLADKLHKGFVMACMGVTIVGTAYLGGTFINYLFVVRPEKDSKRLEEARTLLEEGRSKDVLPDLAPTLRT